MKTKLTQLWESTLRKAERLGGFRLYMLGLLLIMFLAYDSQIWRMGFYYDEWEGIFLYKLNFSFQHIWEYFLIDRPFSALIHVLFNPFIGASPVGWHLLGLFLNWAAILFFVKAMLGIWPKKVLAIGWMGLLFGLYPGITRQFVIITSIPHYSSMFLFMLSLWLMVLAFQNKRYRIWLMLASILLGCLQTLLVEFFTGLELIRLLLLFYLVRREVGALWKSFKQTILAWLPYSVIFVIFVAFKFVILPTLQIGGTGPKHTLKFLQQFATAPFGTLLDYANMILQDVMHALIIAWTLPIVPADIELQSKIFLASWSMGILVGLLAFIIMEVWVRKEGSEQSKELFPVQILLLMFLAIFLGGLPGWSIGKQAVGGMWSSRFLFGQVFGVVPLVVISLIWLAGPARRNLQHALLALLLVGSFSFQFRTGNDYARDWDYQRDFFWQLKWRIPALSPQAFIVSPSSATRLTVDYQMAFAINVLYASGYGKTDMPYWWFNGPEDLKSVRENRPNSQGGVSKTFRTINFRSNMVQAVPVISYLSRGCLLVADPVYKDAPLLSDSEKRIFLTSHPEMILPNETSPMQTDVFGKEPAHTWCYYFLKADLSRQYQQWEQVLDLWEQASVQGFQPNYGPEYLPFMEAFAMQDNWPKAVQLTKKANELTVEIQPFLCGNWQRLLLETKHSSARDSAWAEISGLLACDE